MTLLSIRYILLLVLTIPLSPLLYLQSKLVRRKVPDLGEARDPLGTIQYAGRRKINCLCLGESTMAGVGVRRHREGLAGSMAKSLSQKYKASVTFEVCAMSGYTAREVHEKLMPEIKMTDPHIIVLAIGANNAFSMTPPWRFHRQVQELTTDLKNNYPSGLVVFANMPPIRDFPALTPMLRWFLGHYIDILGQVLDTACRNMKSVLYYPRKVTIEDWVTRLKVKAQPGDFFSDGIHPSQLTYDTWGRDIMDFVYDALTDEQHLVPDISEN